MYVKVIKHHNKDCYSLYECNKALVLEVEEAAQNEPIGRDRTIKKRILRLENHSGRVEDIEFNKHMDTEIFFMNSEGKTIDKYAWFGLPILENAIEVK